MGKPIWRGTLSILMMILASACTAGPAASTPVAAETPAQKPTIAFNFPTETSAPTPTPLPDGPFTWTGGERPLLLAHYMPWYQTPDGHGDWGYHWTMNHFEPSQNADGSWSGLASHYTPLTGPYDSSDPRVLEYQALLMKLSGIDGVIIDWYGSEDFWDYGTLNESTARVIETMEKAGLKVVICYEDQTIKHMVENNHLQAADAIPHGQAVMRFLQEAWFGSDAYLKVDGRPLLLTFGPQYFQPAQWSELFSVLAQPPMFITLDGKAADGMSGGYPWPPMWASSNGVLSQERLASYLDEFYAKFSGWDYHTGGAFPGFYDIYKEAGVGAGYGRLDDQGDKTFRFTLQRALDARPDLIQLITWNDYGEGTIIEPTVEFEYRYLEMVQEARRASDPEFAFSTQDLRLPLILYQARVKAAGNADRQAALDQAAAALLDGRTDDARVLLNLQ